MGDDVVKLKVRDKKAIFGKQTKSDIIFIEKEREIAWKKVTCEYKEDT